MTGPTFQPSDEASIDNATRDIAYQAIMRATFDALMQLVPHDKRDEFQRIVINRMIDMAETTPLENHDQSLVPEIRKRAAAAIRNIIVDTLRIDH